MATLQEFVESSIRVADLRGLSPENPIVLTIRDDNGEDFLVVVSPVEITHAVLPFNVLWIVADPASADYQKVLRRSAKDEQAPYRDTWQVITTYEDMFTQSQYYDKFDTILLGELPLEQGVIPKATETAYGVARLNIIADAITDPIFVGDNDPRLDDPRIPVTHTHSEVPAIELGDATNKVYIANSPVPTVGTVLTVQDGDTDAHWRLLNWDDVQVSDAAITSIEIEGPLTADEMTFQNFALYANYSTGQRLPITATSWSVNSGATITSQGVFYADDVTGDVSFTITATYDGTDGTTHTTTHDILVHDLDPISNPLVSIQILGPSSVDENTSSVYSVVATYQDASTAPAVGSTWSVDDETAASVQQTGALSGLEVDQNTDIVLTASYTDGGVTKTASMTVTIVDTTMPHVTGITITGPTNIDELTTHQYVAEANYSDGTSQPITPAWSVSDTNVATILIDGNLSANDVTGDQTIDVTATFTDTTGTHQGTYSITVADTTIYLQSITVTGSTSVDENSADVQYSAVALLSDGTTPDITGDATWDTNDHAVGTMAASGLLTTVDVLGNQTLTVSATWSYQGGAPVTGELAISVIDTTDYLVSIEITGATSVDETLTEQYTATATYSQSGAVDVTSQVAWSQDHGASSIDAAGLFEAGSVTQDEAVVISASFSDGGLTRTDDHSITVVDTTVYPVSIAVTGPVTNTLRENLTHQYTAIMTDSLGDTHDVTADAKITWSTSNSGVAVVTAVGLVQANEVTQDTAVNIEASYTDQGVTVTDTAVLTVTDYSVDEVDYVEVRGASTVNEGATAQYSVVAVFQSGSEEDISAHATSWNAVLAGHATITPTGLLTGEEVTQDESVTVSAVINWTDERYALSGQDVTVQMTITIKDVFVESLTITGPASLWELEQADLDATANFSDGSTQTVNLANWDVDLPGAATVDANGVVDVLELSANANVVVSGDFVWGGVTYSDTHTINVKNIVPSLSISGDTTLDENTTDHVYTLVAVFNDGGSYTADSIVWSVDSAEVTITVDPGDMSISLDVDELSANELATLTVDYVWKGVTYQATLEVSLTDITVSSIVITGATTLEELTQEQYVFEAHYSNGTQATITEDPNTTLSTDPISVATISATGLLDANEVDGDQPVDVQIDYVFGGVTYPASRSVTVEDVVATGLVINGSGTVNETFDQQYTLTLQLSNGDTESVASTSWVIQSGTAASINSSGLLHANEIEGGNDTVTIFVDYTRKGVTVSATKVVTIADNILTHIEFDAGAATVTENTTENYTVRAYYQDGTSRDITNDPNITWDSSHPAIGTMAAGGVLTTYEITDDTQISIIANFTEQTVSKSDSYQVLVTDIVVPTGVLIVNGVDELNEGGTAQYAAVIEYSDDSQGSPTGPVTWSVDDELVATISTGGLLTAQQVTGNQNVTITANYTEDSISVAGTRTVLVKDIVVTSLEITAVGGGAAITSMNEDTTYTFAARASYSDGTTDVVTPVWSLSPVIGSINASGLFSPGQVGSDTAVTVSASYTENAVTVTDDHIVTVTDIPVSPTSITIESGTSPMDESTQQTFTVKVGWDDGTDTFPTTNLNWTTNAGASGSIGAATGVFTANDVDGDQVVSINVSYTDPVTGTTVSTPTNGSTFSLTITDLDTPAPTLPRWGSSALETLDNEAQVLAACPNELPDSQSGQTFNVDSGITDYLYFAAPASLGNVQFSTDGGSHWGDWDGINHAGGFPDNIPPYEKVIQIGGESWNVYRSDWQNFDNYTYTIQYI